MLYVGDYDPAGLLIDRAIEAELRSHLRTPLTVHRIAINPEQIDTYDLPAKPRKANDRRRPDLTQTVEAEAMPAEDMRSLVRVWVENFIDRDAVGRGASGRTKRTGGPLGAWPEPELILRGPPHKTEKTMTDTPSNKLLTRAFGLLADAGGAGLRGYVVDDDKTHIVMLDQVLGSIVKDAGTGRWAYDEALRSALGIKDDPSFDTDGEAGDGLQERLPPDEQMRAFAQGLIESGRKA